MNNILDEKSTIWRISKTGWALWLVAIIALGILFYDALSYMVYTWDKKEEYGHGFLIPFLTWFFIWQQKTNLEKYEFENGWLGFLFILPGLVMYVAGQLATLYVVVQYAFVFILYGLVYSFTGKRAFKTIAIPLFLLFLMIPLPDFLYQNLSAKLQLLSTQIGVFVIRLMDISVFVQGNVIDLGTFKLQVVDACSGLRYLFPLMTLGFIAAYMYKQALWKRAVLFLSAIPITVLMNSFRIGVIGITVEYWGKRMAEGFLHDFEGWIVFMSCIGILILEMALLSMVGKDKLPLRDVFGLDIPEPFPEDAEVRERGVTKSFIAAITLLVIILMSSIALPDRHEHYPERKQYSMFPTHFEGWKGRHGDLEQIYIDALKLDDYAMIDYSDSQGHKVNFYSAYYNSQRKGSSAHSPRSCIPGGGWRIQSLKQISVPNTYINGKQLRVNRLVIAKGDIKQLVYYWFQQRNRDITNEYMVKIYLFWDALTENRTDGALIRLTTEINTEDTLESADKRLSDFTRKISPIITQYVPN